MVFGAKITLQTPFAGQTEDFRAFEQHNLDGFLMMVEPGEKIRQIFQTVLIKLE